MSMSFHAPPSMELEPTVATCSTPRQDVVPSFLAPSKRFRPLDSDAAHSQLGRTGPCGAAPVDAKRPRYVVDAASTSPWTHHQPHDQQRPTNGHVVVTPSTGRPPRTATGSSSSGDGSGDACWWRGRRRAPSPLPPRPGCCSVCGSSSSDDDAAAAPAHRGPALAALSTGNALLHRYFAPAAPTSADGRRRTAAPTAPAVMSTTPAPPAPCHFCGKAACGACRRACAGCGHTFCGFCRTSDYATGREHVCLDCLNGDTTDCPMQL